MTTPNFTTATDLDLCLYFIAKFESLPDEKWARASFKDPIGRRCALGHCGVLHFDDVTDESDALVQVMGDRELAPHGFWPIIYVSDGGVSCPPKYRNIETPRGRILAALRDELAELEAQ